MSWRDALQDASFRGVSFKVQSHTYNAGRRTNVHQYINRDEPYSEDLGREAEGFTVEAYILQSPDNDYNYFADRDDLIDALNKKGSGILIHPFLGIKKVNPGAFSMSESFGEGGIARFSISFTEAGKRALSGKVFDVISRIDNKINEISDLVGDFFATAFDIGATFAELPSNAISSVTSVVQTTIKSIQSLPTQVANEANKNIGRIQDTVDSIVEFPNEMYNAVKSAVGNIGSMCGLGNTIEEEQKATQGTATDDGVVVNERASDSYVEQTSVTFPVYNGDIGSYSGVARGENIEFTGNEIPAVVGESVIKGIVDNFGEINVDAFGVTPGSQQNNIVMIFDIFKLQMISMLCRIAVRTTYNNRDDIIRNKETILDLFDDFLEDLGDEAASGSSAVGIGNGSTAIWNQDVFKSVQDLRNVFAESMDDLIDKATQLIDEKIAPAGNNSLLLSYQKYKDLGRSTEIYLNNKNAIRHPGFIKPGDTIRILNE